MALNCMLSKDPSTRDASKNGGRDVFVMVAVGLKPPVMITPKNPDSGGPNSKLCAPTFNTKEFPETTSVFFQSKPRAENGRSKVQSIEAFRIGVCVYRRN